MVQSSHSGILLLGSNDRVDDTVFHDIGYAHTSAGAIATDPARATAQLAITHNSISRTSGIGIFFDAASASRLSYNDVRETCLHIPDCGPLYAWNTNGLGTSIDHNVVSSVSWDTTNGIYLDDGSYGYVIHHNVVLSYGLAGIGVKGPGDVFNNTVLSSGLAPIAYTPPPPGAAAAAPTDLRAMVVANNIFSGSPSVVVSLTLGPSDDAAYFKHTVIAAQETASYQVAFSELRLQTQATPRPFDLTQPRSLQIVPGVLDGAFDLWLDDVELVGVAGVSDLLDDFEDGDDAASTGVYWWAGAGQGSALQSSVTTDPTTGSAAAHLMGDQVPGGWVSLSLDLSQLDLSRILVTAGCASSTRDCARECDFWRYQSEPRLAVSRGAANSRRGPLEARHPGAAP